MNNIILIEHNLNAISIIIELLNNKNCIFELKHYDEPLIEWNKNAEVIILEYNDFNFEQVIEFVTNKISDKQNINNRLCLINDCNSRFYHHALLNGITPIIIHGIDNSVLIELIDRNINVHRAIKEFADSKIDELKLSLASLIPHEFRTPLHGIISSSQLLMEFYKSMEEDEIRQIHYGIHKASIRLNRLVMNFLTLVELSIMKSEYGTAISREKHVTYCPADVLNEIFTKRSQNDLRVSDLSLSLEDSKISIMSNHFSLLVNELCDNCFKFSEKGNQIAVETKVNGSVFHLSILNYGRAMTDEQINEIGPFIQFERKVFEQQGSGLGLAIVKKICDLYKLDFHLESSYGEYIEVKISFPIATD